MKYTETSLPWNEYDKIISEYSDHSFEGFKIYYGECDHQGITTIFRFLFINMKTNNYYRYSFNGKWCPEDHKEWLMGIIYYRNNNPSN